MKAVGRLLARHLQGLAPGRLEWIGVRPERKVPMQLLNRVTAIAGAGLEGDRRCNGTEGSARQVTLINAEHIQLLEQLLGRDTISPELLRRNLVVSGINMIALRHQHFRIGEVVFEATAHCHPCVRMEQALGKGAVAAMLGHGGVCAKILSSGEIKIGDSVQKMDASDAFFSAAGED